MVLLGYFYREALESASTEGWTTSLDSSLEPLKKSVGTSALKSRNQKKPVFVNPPTLSRTPSTSWIAPYQGSTAATAAAAAAVAAASAAASCYYSMSNDGAIYEFETASTTTRTGGGSGIVLPIKAASSGTASSSSSAVTSPDFDSRGRSSSVWSSSSNAATSSVRSRSSRRGSLETC